MKMTNKFERISSEVKRTSNPWGHPIIAEIESRMLWYDWKEDPMEEINVVLNALGLKCIWIETSSDTYCFIIGSIDRSDEDLIRECEYVYFEEWDQEDE